MARPKPRICTVITGKDSEAIAKATALTDFFEVRIDMIGQGWWELARRLKKPWVACNRRPEEGGRWQGGERERIRELLVALEYGAEIIDLELATPNLESIIRELKGKVECLLSYHNPTTTPPLIELKETVRRQLDSGADICKVVTTARTATDNLTILTLIREFPKNRIVAFAMGKEGVISRVLSPLAGGYFTYASLGEGMESAEGQLTVAQLKRLYETLEDD
ncbi:MAG: type I 3-dehydroquinate dehydratase [Dehalococcoidales bacterium]|nr:type I 3-dehydroquinate dehydratase [Dehalococcoidales bacterium]